MLTMWLKTGSLINRRALSGAKAALSSRAMSSSGKLDLTGVYPPIPTPFKQDESIDWEALRSNLTLWNEHDLRGYLVQGSNGEYCYLTLQERVDMIRVVKESAGKKMLVLAGSGCESTRQTIDLTCQMAEAGADAAVVITPCYFKGKMTGEVLEKHYTAVADASPIPVVLYSVPANTTLDMDPGTVANLASHPNIVGIKDSGGDITKIGKMVADTAGEDFQVLAGSASFLLPSLAVGAVGGICALANVLPAEVARLQALCMDNKWDEAKLLQHKLIGPNGAVTKQFGVPGLKESMEWFGFHGGPTRMPLVPLKQNESVQLKKIFTSHGFL